MTIFYCRHLPYSRLADGFAYSGCAVLPCGQHRSALHHPALHDGASRRRCRQGAVEQDRRGQKTNISLTGQNPHRDQDPLLKSSNSDYPEPGQNEEHSGEPHTHHELDDDTDANCRKR
jgi:hypothetical protein